MLKFTQRQREVLSDKLPDVANLAAAGLVFGQLLGDRPFSWNVALLGFSLWLALTAVSLFLVRRR